MNQTSGQAPYYNVIAGHSLDRLAGISDGIFSVGMTLLVLGLTVPAVAGINGEGDLARALAQLLPNAVTYAMSFLTLGIFWVAQQTQFSQLKTSDRNYTWIHIGFLLAVTLGLTAGASAQPAFSVVPSVAGQAVGLTVTFAGTSTLSGRSFAALPISAGRSGRA